MVMSGLLTTRTCTRHLKLFYKLFSQTRCLSKTCQSDENIRRFISENTEVVGGQSLTPEIKLRLFTPDCRFWRERPELWPFDDPYWAIYWPGGQALSRYGISLIINNGQTLFTSEIPAVNPHLTPPPGRFVLDNPEVCRGQTVLDLGSGCGASAIAAQLCGAARVVANDIDTVAAVATHMNCELNNVESPVCVTDNLIGSEPGCFDLILLGDMFYDEALATSLHSWLDRCIKVHGTKVLIGDPGRTQFEGLGIRRLLHQLAQFELPESVREENYGLTCSSVWCYNPKL